jgi:hypothetical protein
MDEATITYPDPSGMSVNLLTLSIFSYRRSWMDSLDQKPTHPPEQFAEFVRESLPPGWSWTVDNRAENGTTGQTTVAYGDDTTAAARACVAAWHGFFGTYEQELKSKATVGS